MDGVSVASIQVIRTIESPQGTHWTSLAKRGILVLLTHTVVPVGNALREAEFMVLVYSLLEGSNL